MYQNCQNLTKNCILNLVMKYIDINFVHPTSTHPASKQDLTFKRIFSEKDEYVQYFPNATFASSVAFVGAVPFQFPGRVIFGDFRRRMSRNKNWFLPILRFASNKKNV